jgi:hypothetical protein
MRTHRHLTALLFGQKLDVVFPADVLFPPLSPLPLNGTTNPDHGHSGQGFEDKAVGSWANGLDYAVTPGPGVNVPSVANYIDLIEKYAYANHVLQSNEGPSFDAHQYAIAGQSGGLSDSGITPEGMTENALPASPDFSTYAPPGEGTCYSATAPPHGQHVDTVNMYSPYPTPSPSSAPPCVEYQTIFDVLVNAQTPPTPEPYDLWQYAAKDTTSIWSAPMAIEHLYTAYSSDASDKSQQPFAVDPDAENFVLNITGSVSPTPNPSRPFAWLTYITPCVPESDHPNHLASDGSGVDNGPEWLAWLLNAIGSSSYWDSTAVIVTWDDWGGFYDGYRPTPWPYHPTPNPYGPPPTGNPKDPNEWGFRVPMIVISPYVKSRNYVATELESQGAILNFVETIFDLTPNALGGDDFNNGGNDLTDMFSMDRSPLTWSSLTTLFTPAPVGACPTPSQLLPPSSR